MKPIDKFLENYNLIQGAIGKSDIYKQAFNSFKEGFKDFSFTPQEQAQALATFMAQITLGLQAQSLDTALRVEVSDLQAQELRSKIALESDILKSQALGARYQIEASKFQAQAQNALAKQEEIKCQVLVKSANDNTAINRVNSMVEYANVMGNATNPKALDAISTRVRDEVFKIGKDPQSVQAISQKPKAEQDFENAKDSLITYEGIANLAEYPSVFIYASKNVLALGEVGLFGVAYNLNECEGIEWLIDGTEQKEFSDSEVMECTFDSVGYKKIEVKLKSTSGTAKEYSDTLVVWVK